MRVHEPNLVEISKETIVKKIAMMAQKISKIFAKKQIFITLHIKAHQNFRPTLNLNKTSTILGPYMFRDQNLRVAHVQILALQT